MATIAALAPSYKSLFLNLQFNGTELAKGTGFITQSSIGPVLITNRHNFTGRDNETGDLLNKKNAGVPSEVAIWHNRKGQLGSWIKLIEPLFFKDKPLWIEHARLGAQADVVALPLTQIDNIDLYTYEFKEIDLTFADIGTSKICLFQQLKPADMLSVVGFPYGLSMGGRFAIWVTDFVASEPGLDYPFF